MEAAHGRLGNACLLLSRAAGALEAACAEYEAAQQTVKRWWVIARLLFSEPSEDVCARTRLTLLLPSQHRRYQAEAEDAQLGATSANPSAASKRARLPRCVSASHVRFSAAQ